MKDEFETIIDAQPSRDANTILENWIKVIPHLKEDDFLVICFPTLTRTRLPFDKKSLEVQRKVVCEELNRSLGGIADMRGVPNMLFVIDTNIESLAVAEARNSKKE